MPSPKKEYPNTLLLARWYPMNPGQLKLRTVNYTYFQLWGTLFLDESHWIDHNPYGWSSWMGSRKLKWNSASLRAKHKLIIYLSDLSSLERLEPWNVSSSPTWMPPPNSIPWNYHCIWVHGLESIDRHLSESKHNQTQSPRQYNLGGPTQWNSLEVAQSRHLSYRLEVFGSLSWLGHREAEQRHLRPPHPQPKSGSFRGHLRTSIWKYRPSPRTMD